MARRRSNPFINAVLLNETFAAQRDIERMEREELYNSEQNGYPAEERSGYKVYPASELGLLRKATDTSLSREQREEALHAASYADRELTELDWFKDDLMDHLRVIRYSAAAYYRSPLLAVLSVLMLAGHAAMLFFIVGVSIADSSAEGPFGDSVFGNIIVGWTIYNVAALTFAAFSPLLLTSLPRGIWRLVGGKSHRIVQLLMVTSAVPAILSGWVLVSGGGSGVHPVVPVVFFAHAVLPLVIRKLAAVTIRKQIRKLSRQVGVLSEALHSDENTVYLTSMLERKIIGTPGASLGTSGFSDEQVAAGVAGERNTARILDDFARRHDSVIVFHSVRWNMNGAPYDIDHVVVVGQRVFFLDSKNWSKGNYTMLASGDTVIKDGVSIPNGAIHIQSGADTYINAYGISDFITQVVVWTEGALSNQSVDGPRLVTGDGMLGWLEQSVRDEASSSAGYNVPLLRRLEANTAQ